MTDEPKAGSAPGIAIVTKPDKSPGEILFDEAEKRIAAFRAELAQAKEEIERLKKQSDVRLDVFYQLWDLADRAVGGDISETAFIDGRKEVIAILARKAGGGE